VTALAVGVLAPGPQDILPARLLRDGEAVVLPGGDKNKGVLGVGKVDRFGLLANVAGGFGVGYLFQL
jgi:hypothetical protein